MSYRPSNVFCKYGAPMGRDAFHHPSADGARFNLQRVAIDQGGYDAGGAYWGTPSNLYVAYTTTDDAGYVCFYFRADSRDAAKARVRQRYPNARFYR